MIVVYNEKTKEIKIAEIRLCRENMYREIIFLSNLCLFFIKGKYLTSKHWKYIFLFIGHFLIDCWKCDRSWNGKGLGSDLVIDQLLHIAQIGVCLYV